MEKIILLRQFQFGGTDAPQRLLMCEPHAIIGCGKDAKIVELLKWNRLPRHSETAVRTKVVALRIVLEMFVN